MKTKTVIRLSLLSTLLMSLNGCGSDDSVNKQEDGWTTNEWVSSLSQGIPESVYMFLVNDGLGL